MKVTRILHPIGQGGFYSEKLEAEANTVNVIYDCGGNNKNTIEEYMDCYYPGEKTRKIMKNVNAL